jgi:hypothetical protein
MLIRKNLIKSFLTSRPKTSIVPEKKIKKTIIIEKLPKKTNKKLDEIAPK